MTAAGSGSLHAERYASTFSADDAKSSRLTVGEMSYGGNWHGSGQIPARAVDRGSVSRYDSLDPDEGASYQKKWAAEIVFDPFYNERFLTVAPPTFLPCINQRML